MDPVALMLAFLDAAVEVIAEPSMLELPDPDPKPELDELELPIPIPIPIPVEWLEPCIPSEPCIIWNYDNKISDMLAIKESHNKTYIRRTADVANSAACGSAGHAGSVRR